MYRKTKKYPEYKLIIDDKEKMEIDIDELKEGDCLNDIEDSLNNYITIEDYLDVIFEKSTKKQKEENEDIEQLKDIKKRRKIKPTLVLKEAEEVFEEPKEELKEQSEVEIKENLKDILFPKEEKIDIIPVKKRRTRKQKEQKVKVNPLGKKSVTKKRKMPDNIEILDIEEELN